MESKRGERKEERERQEKKNLVSLSISLLSSSTMPDFNPLTSPNEEWSKDAHSDCSELVPACSNTSLVIADIIQRERKQWDRYWKQEAAIG